MLNTRSCEQLELIFTKLRNKANLHILGHWVSIKMLLLDMCELVPVMSLTLCTRVLHVFPRSRTLCLQPCAAVTFSPSGPQAHEARGAGCEPRCCAPHISLWHLELSGRGGAAATAARQGPCCQGSLPPLPGSSLSLRRCDTHDTSHYNVHIRGIFYQHIHSCLKIHGWFCSSFKIICSKCF